VYSTRALKGATTFIVVPNGEAYRYDGGGMGFATSGSSDALAGIVAGLLARGAAPVRAAAWAVYLHGEAGNAMAKARRRIGFLARELLAEVPRIMAKVG
jgi:ADP-dependent NAD(P)H-hydrate dehydratase